MEPKIYSRKHNSSNGTIRYTPGTPTLAMEPMIYFMNHNPRNGTIRYTPGTKT